MKQFHSNPTLQCNCTYVLSSTLHFSLNFQNKLLINLLFWFFFLISFFFLPQSFIFLPDTSCPHQNKQDIYKGSYEKLTWIVHWLSKWLHFDFQNKVLGNQELCRVPHTKKYFAQKTCFLGGYSHNAFIFLYCQRVFSLNNFIITFLLKIQFMS